MRVTAGIFRDKDKVLMMRRGPKQPLPLQWEFPGGKFEPGEDGAQCIKRELAEELGINVTVGDLFAVVRHITESGNVLELHAYEILKYTGNIKLQVHDKMEWVPISNLTKHPQLPADLLVSKMLIKQQMAKVKE